MPSPARSDLADRRGDLCRLVRGDPDPRVRRRADALVRVAEGQSLAAAARAVRTGPNRIRAWRGRFLADGRDGLADRPRSGRPPKLGEADRAFLREAADAGPRAYDQPFDVWGLADLAALLAARRDVAVSAWTVRRALFADGYRYRRPRHDLAHRQNAEAVAQTQAVLAWLQGKAGRTPPPSGSCTPTSARSTATHGWRRSGSAAGGR